MEKYTRAEVAKEIRAIAKENGMTFKRQPRLTINGNAAYMFVDRRSGERVIENCTFWSAYQNCISGAVENLKRN